MKGMLRFSGAVKRDPAIDVWLNEQAPELGAIAQTWFVRMRDCGRDVRELMHDGYPTACVGDAPFGYVGVFRAHVNVGFFYGAELRDSMGLLAGSGRRMRHVKIRPGGAPNVAGLRALINAAYGDIKSRLGSMIDGPPPSRQVRECEVCAVRSRVAADEAGASDGASPLISVLYGGWEMGYDLTSESGGDLRFGGAGWALLLSVAEAYGWAQQGSLAPDGTDAADWSGDYDTNDGARVSREDAGAMADALARALADPERAEKERQIGRELNRAVRQMEIEAFGEDIPEEEEEELLTTDDGLPHTVIDFFLRAGSFTID
jgi:hypothetical protein